MKKLLTVLLAIGLVSIGKTQGPPPGMDDDKIEALRVAFLTRYLDLSTEEAQKFWPVFNKMQDEVQAVMEKERNLQNGKQIDDMSDDELNKLLTAHFDNEQKLLDIKRKYADEFRKVLPLKKVAKLADAENAFRRELMMHAKDRQGPGGPGGGKGDKGGKGPGGGPGGGPAPTPGACAGDPGAQCPNGNTTQCPYGN
ncbi:MAG: hypothetical protein R2794_09165 [Chitinophagales bacterium]